jgi:hypothetical protein
MIPEKYSLTLHDMTRMPAAIINWVLYFSKSTWRVLSFIL